MQRESPHVSSGLCLLPRTWTALPLTALRLSFLRTLRSKTATDNTHDYHPIFIYYFVNTTSSLSLFPPYSLLLFIFYLFRHYYLYHLYSLTKPQRTPSLTWLPVPERGVGKHRKGSLCQRELKEEVDWWWLREKLKDRHIPHITRACNTTLW